MLRFPKRLSFVGLPDTASEWKVSVAAAQVSYVRWRYVRGSVEVARHDLWPPVNVAAGPAVTQSFVEAVAGGWPWGVMLSKDGEVLLVSDALGLLRLWELKTMPGLACRP